MYEVDIIEVNVQIWRSECKNSNLLSISIVDAIIRRNVEIISDETQTDSS